MCYVTAPVRSVTTDSTALPTSADDPASETNTTTPFLPSKPASKPASTLSLVSARSSATSQLASSSAAESESTASVTSTIEPVSETTRPSPFLSAATSASTPSLLASSSSSATRATSTDSTTGDSAKTLITASTDDVTSSSILPSKTAAADVPVSASGSASPAVGGRASVVAGHVDSTAESAADPRTTELSTSGGGDEPVNSLAVSTPATVSDSSTTVKAGGDTHGHSETESSLAQSHAVSTPATVSDSSTAVKTDGDTRGHPETESSPTSTTTSPGGVSAFGTTDPPNSTTGETSITVKSAADAGDTRTSAAHHSAAAAVTASGAAFNSPHSSLPASSAAVNEAGSSGRTTAMTSTDSVAEVTTSGRLSATVSPSFSRLSSVGIASSSVQPQTTTIPSADVTSYDVITPSTTFSSLSTSSVADVPSPVHSSHPTTTVSSTNSTSAMVATPSTAISSSFSSWLSSSAAEADSSVHTTMMTSTNVGSHVESTATASDYSTTTETVGLAPRTSGHSASPGRTVDNEAATTPASDKITTVNTAGNTGGHSETESSLAQSHAVSTPATVSNNNTTLKTDGDTRGHSESSLTQDITPTQASATVIGHNTTEPADGLESETIGHSASSRVTSMDISKHAAGTTLYHSSSVIDPHPSTSSTTFTEARTTGSISVESESSTPPVSPSITAVPGNSTETADEAASSVVELSSTSSTAEPVEMSANNSITTTTITTTTTTESTVHETTKASLGKEAATSTKTATEASSTTTGITTSLSAADSATAAFAATSSDRREFSNAHGTTPKPSRPQTVPVTDRTASSVIGTSSSNDDDTQTTAYTPTQSSAATTTSNLHANDYNPTSDGLPSSTSPTGATTATPQLPFRSRTSPGDRRDRTTADVRQIVSSGTPDSDDQLAAESSVEVSSQTTQVSRRTALSVTGNSVDGTSPFAAASSEVTTATSSTNSTAIDATGISSSFSSLPSSSVAEADSSVRPTMMTFTNVGSHVASTAAASDYSTTTETGRLAPRTSGHSASPGRTVDNEATTPVSDNSTTVKTDGDTRGHSETESSLTQSHAVSTPATVSDNRTMSGVPRSSDDRTPSSDLSTSKFDVQTTTDNLLRTTGASRAEMTSSSEATDSFGVTEHGTFSSSGYVDLAGTSLTTAANSLHTRSAVSAGISLEVLESATSAGFAETATEDIHRDNTLSNTSAESAETTAGEGTSLVEIRLSAVTWSTAEPVVVSSTAAATRNTSNSSDFASRVPSTADTPLQGKPLSNKSFLHSSSITVRAVATDCIVFVGVCFSLLAR